MHPSSSLRPRLLRHESPLKPRTPKAFRSLLNRYSSSPRFHSRPTSASPVPPDTRRVDTSTRHQHEHIHFTPHIGVKLTVSLQRLHHKRKLWVESLLRSQQTTPRRDVRTVRLNGTPSPRPTELLKTVKTAGSVLREKSRALGKIDLDSSLIQRLKRETKNRQSVRVKSTASNAKKLTVKASAKAARGQEVVEGGGLSLHKPLKRHLLRG